MPPPPSPLYTPTTANNPSKFRFTAPSNPRRHLQAAEAFGVDISNVKESSAGEVLADAIQSFLEELGDQPRGLRALGFGSGDVAALVEGTIPQARVLGLAPGFGGVGGVLTSGGGAGDVEREREVLGGLFEEAMEY